MNFLIDMAAEPMSARRRSILHLRTEPRTIWACCGRLRDLPSHVWDRAWEAIIEAYRAPGELHIPSDLMNFLFMRGDEWMSHMEYPSASDIEEFESDYCDNCGESCNEPCDSRYDAVSDCMAEHTDVAMDWFHEAYAAWVADGGDVIQERFPIRSRGRVVEIGPGIVTPYDGYGVLAHDIMHFNGRGASPERNWRTGARERMLRETGTWTLLPRAVRVGAGFP